jgi:uncharacterized Zn finger protein
MIPAVINHADHQMQGVHMSAIETNIACPKCKQPLAISLAEMTPNHTTVCHSCGTAIKFSGQDASKVQNIINQLEASGAKINIKVNVKSKRPWWRFWG